MEQRGADQWRVDDGSRAPLPAILMNCEFQLLAKGLPLSGRPNYR
jgi:hypothetical protein